MKLYLIAGHGDGDPGAVGNGYTEADLVRRLCQRIKAFGGDAVVYLDPSKDWVRTGGISTYPFPEDAQVLESHLDSSGNSGAHGGHVIIDADFEPDGYDEALANAVAAMFPGRSSKIVKRNDLKNPNLAQTKGVSYRLCEYCFVSNAGDVAKFVSKIDDVARMVLGAFGIAPEAETAGTWRQSDDGRWWLERPDGSYPKDGWELVGGYWYLFDSDGWMLTGWHKVGGKWYYMADSGAMLADAWVQVSEGRWSWLTSDGSAATDGWCKVKGKWAYFDSDGYAAASKIIESGGKYYAIGDDCYMLEGAIPLDDSGAMVL